MEKQDYKLSVQGKQTERGYYPYKYEGKTDSYYSPSYYGDRRLDKRTEEMVSRMIRKQSCIVQRLSSGDSSLRAYERLLNHHSLTPGRMIGQLLDGYAGGFGEEDVLVIQDTCSLGFGRLRGRLRDERGLGYTDTARSWGCFVHPGLVVGAECGALLGLSSVLIWSLEASAFGYDARKRERDPIETKSSYRWIETAQGSKVHLARARRITFIADREADIYEAFATLPDARSHFIIRSADDRNIVESPGKIGPYVDQLPVAGTYPTTIRGDARIPRAQRQAVLSVRFAPFQMRRPYKAKSSHIEAYPQSLPLYVVDLREETPPADGPPIHWRLYTTHRVETYAQARQIIQWYEKRWYIEQLFRLLQNQGLDIEANRLFSAMAIVRLLIMALEAATAILKLNLAYKAKEQIDIEQVFDQDQQACLERLNLKLQGNTQRLKNPFQSHDLAWAAWIIARLGGWMGDPNKAKPGPISFKRGYLRFIDIYLGFNFQNIKIDTS